MNLKNIVHIALFVISSVVVFCNCNTSQDNNKKSTWKGMTKPSPSDGIDVSNHNGKIDWDKVVKNNPTISFVYVKASEGATYKDARYLDNIRGARKAGLKVGAYHYFRMTSSVEEQYKNFISQLENAPFDLIPMVDVETNDKQPIKRFRSRLREFLDKLENKYSVAPVIYGTNKSYNELCGSDFDEKYPLYIGRYGKNVPVVKGKSAYTVWQYSEKGWIEGISKSVDLCRFNPKCDISDLSMPSAQNIKP